MSKTIDKKNIEPHLMPEGSPWANHLHWIGISGMGYSLIGFFFALLTPPPGEHQPIGIAILLWAVSALVATLWRQWTIGILSTGSVVVALYLTLQFFADI